MAKRHWNLGIIRLFNDVIYEEALSHESEGLTNGLRFHLIDICIEELAYANANAEIPLTEATFLDCVEPFFALAQNEQQYQYMFNTLQLFNQHIRNHTH